MEENDLSIEWDSTKEAANLRKHGLDFSFAAAILSDPLAITLPDRVENGEERWHTIGTVGGSRKVLLLVHSFPDPDDDRRIRVIGLRAATPHERRRYEEDTHP